MPSRLSPLEKTSALLAYDNQWLMDWQARGLTHLIGVDEVGRGSLIGPVVAAAVSFPRPEEGTGLAEALAGLNDSKQVPPAERQRLVVEIRRVAQYAIAMATQEEVETYNVSVASLMAARRAVVRLLAQSEPGLASHSGLLMDGKWPLLDCPVALQAAVIKGDGQSAHIAAASILAKEWRDDWVREQAAFYPGYGWERNMGYATAQHQEAMARQGLTPLHRKTFRLQQLVLPI